MRDQRLRTRMATDPPQAEDLRYWLKHFNALGRQQRLVEYAKLREYMKDAAAWHGLEAQLEADYTLHEAVHKALA